MSLKASAPVDGPIGDVAVFGDTLRDVGLFAAVLCANLCFVFDQVFVNVNVSPDVKSVDRGVSGSLRGFIPFSNDAERSGDLKERVDVLKNYHIEVEKKSLSTQVAELWSEVVDLVPSPGFCALGQILLRHRKDFDVGVKIFIVVGKADEAMRQRQVTTDHAVKLVHIGRIVLASPFHTNDVTVNDIHVLLPGDRQLKPFLVQSGGFLSLLLCAPSMQDRIETAAIARIS